MTNKTNNDNLSKEEIANKLRSLADNLDKTSTNKSKLSRQGPSIHIDQESLNDIKTLEEILKIKHHNEIIKLLINFYIENQDPKRQEQFKIIKEITK